MSVKVLDQVLDGSEATGVARCVLTALADAAHHDGVTWAPQGPRENPRSVAHRANCSVRSVERAVEQLVAAGELEVRRARRGRSWVNVYRVVVGTIGQIEVEYQRLPFDLDEWFSDAAALAVRGTLSTRQLGGMNQGVDPDEMAASSGSFMPPESADSSRQAVALNPPEEDPYARAILFDPSLDPKRDPSARAAAAVDPEQLEQLAAGLRRLGVSAAARLTAMGDPRRAFAWLDVACKEGKTNPAGLFVDGYASGEWPSARGCAHATRERHRAAREASLANLVHNHGVDEARYLIDVEWSDLTSVERADLHELVDGLASDELPVAIAPAQAGVEAGAV